ncbi:MAG: thioredoxin domain-containing protein [Candidatus Nanohaloarchaea archaeon]|nr:thioredoxin domain-containing protein [Candidatus Nanohaloarchaea archaeon]
MSQSIEVTLKITHALILAFAIGVVTGGFTIGTVQAFQSTPTGAAAAQPSGGGTGSSGGTQPSPSPSPSGGSQGSAGSGGVSVSNFDIEGEPTIGSSDAPVTIAYWGDYQCPFCKRFEQNTFPQIKQNYISKGKARLVFKDFAFLGQDSTTGSIASECVWNQVGNSNPQAYWEWHSMMYDRQDGENSGWGNQEDIVNMTRSVQGIDADQLQSCMNNKESQLKQEISEDRNQGQQVGISGTPGFVIYKTGADSGTKIVGAQPYSRFQSVIDQALNGGGGQDTGGTPDADKTIQISGTEYSFSPSTISVTKGETVRIEFTNTGQIPHNLNIPSLGVGTRTIQPGQTSSFTFTAPESGTFPIQFECTLPGHAENGMTGTIRSG